MTWLLNALWLFIKAFALTVWGLAKGVLLNVGVIYELNEVLSFTQPYKLIALSLGISPIIVRVALLVVKQLKHGNKTL